MYFSEKMKLSKVLSLILVLTLVCTLFAGCQKGGDETTPPTETSPGLNLNLSESTAPTETEPEETEPVVMNENTGTITQQINVRSTPSMAATITGTLYAGDRVEVKQRGTVLGVEWGYIETPVEGWFNMEFMELDIKPEGDPSGSENDTPNETKPTQNESTVNIKGVVNTNGLNIRDAANTTTSKVVGKYNKGDVVTILELSDGWGRTDKGWIKMEFVTTTGSNTGNNTNKDDEKPGTNTNTDTNITGNGSTKVIDKGIVNVQELNLRANASTGSDRLGSLRYGARVEILEKSGDWGRTSKGWIHMGYIYRDGTTGKNTASGTVTADELNIRSGPGTGYGSVGAYEEGDYIKILEQFTYGDTTWGCTDKGWISLDYVDLDGTDSDDSDDDTDTSDGTVGYVTIDGLRIREGAGTDYDVVGSLDKGDKVTILSTKKVGDTRWGKIRDGWISLEYVTFNNPDNNGSEDSDEVRTGTVNSDGLRIRSGAGTNYGVVGALEYGDEVTVYNTKKVGNTLWGEIDEGWICLDYVDLD